MTKTFGTSASREVIATLESAGYEAVFVGGSVRDHLLGKTASDFDIATSATPDEVKGQFQTTFDIGIEHGTIVVLLEGEPIEVTTYRSENTNTSTYKKATADVPFVQSLHEDLKRRDFTMNAMALKLNGKLVDPFGGVADLQSRIIKAVDNAEDRFNEDPLRMLRAVRFSSVFGFDIELNTFTAIATKAEKIKQVSIERIKNEMDKIWTGSHSQKAIISLLTTGLADHLPLFPKDPQLLINSSPFVNAWEGWANIMLVGDYSVDKVVKAYKLSKKERFYLIDVRSAFMNRIERIYTNDDYYRFPQEVLVVAEKAFSAFHPEASSLNESEIAHAKAELPIHSKEDLAISGKNLLDWKNQRGGHWVGEWISKIESAILHGNVQNEVDDIKEWFLNEYTSEK